MAFFVGLLVISGVFFGNSPALALSFAPAEQAPVTPPESTDPKSNKPRPPDPPQPYWITNRQTKISQTPEPEFKPYWLPENAPLGPTDPQKPANEASKGANSDVAKTAALFSPPPPPPPPAPKPPKPPKEMKPERKAQPGVLIKEFSFYKFTDEQGNTYMTDAPVDPRYRLFTVQITISRGSAPYRRLNLDNLKPLILLAAKKYKVDPVLITSIIKAESAFDPKAVSWAGARGLMQLMPNTAKLVGCLDSFDPEQNIMGGTKYIRMMLDRFNGNVSLAVAAYNSGPERVAKNMAIPAISETRNYVKTVTKNLEYFKPLFDPEDILSTQPVAATPANSPATPKQTGP
ncbi:MAG: lytic transglycosylase domain-containing protein [Deltaproteobacteria bacterium]|nr:lytic transglycosylase domain-containing protein [Deltaproteobacteria bacterium]